MSKDKLNSNVASECKNKEKRKKVYNVASSTQLACGLMFTLCILLLNFLIEKIYVVTNINPLIFFDILFYIAFVFLTSHLSGKSDFFSKVSDKITPAETKSNTSVSDSDSGFDFNFNIVETDTLSETEEVVCWTSDDLFKVFFVIPITLTSLFFVVFLL